MVSSALDQKTYPDSDDKNYVRVANYKCVLTYLLFIDYSSEVKSTIFRSKLIVWAHKGFDDVIFHILVPF